MNARTRNFTSLLDTPAARSASNGRALWLPVAIVGALTAAWASLAPISGAVIAGARIKVELERKTVQHREGGIVRDVTAALDVLPRYTYPFPQHDIFIANLEAVSTRARAIAKDAPPVPLDSVTLLSPVANPGKIIAAPVNYQKHLNEVRVVDGQRIRGSLSLDNATVRREGLANATFFVIRRPRFFASEGARSFVTLYRASRREPRLEHLRGHAKNVIRDLPDLARTGAWLARRGRLEEGDTLLLAAQAEQRPNPDSRVELDTAVDATGAHRPRLDWRLTAEDRESVRRTQDLLDAADLPNGRVNELAKMAEDPYLTQTGFFEHYDHPTEGAMVTTSIPVQFSATPASLRLRPPALGEHTAEVLREHGMEKP